MDLEHFLQQGTSALAPAVAVAGAADTWNIHQHIFVMDIANMVDEKICYTFSAAAAAAGTVATAVVPFFQQVAQSPQLHAITVGHPYTTVLVENEFAPTWFGPSQPQFPVVLTTRCTAAKMVRVE